MKLSGKTSPLFVVGWACRVVIAGVFIYAALHKISDPPGFALAVFRYQLVPYTLVNLAAIFMPWIELVAALALLFAPRFRDAGAAVFLGMLLMFTIAMIINISRGINVACGCFSFDPEVSRIGWLTVTRNLVLMVVAGVAFVSSFTRRSRA